MGIVNTRPNRLAIEALQVGSTDDVLELGFGPGLAIRRLTQLAPEGHIIGIDHSPQMLALAARRNRRVIGNSRVTLLLSSFADTGLPDACVDKVLAVNVAYFFHADAREVREIRRVLRVNGRLVIYVTHAESMRNWKFAHGGSHRLLNEDDLKQMLLDGGFGNDEITIRRVRVTRTITGLLAVANRSG